MDFKELYIEIMVFLGESGGTYRNVDVFTSHDIIDSVFDGRYRITRNESGRITGFTSWWMIHKRDLEMVKNGERPADIHSGPIVYIADHAGENTCPGLMKHIRRTMGEIDSCWHHRFKHPRQFRYREARLA